MEILKEYVITLYHLSELEEFYNDMETLRPTLYNCMPERSIVIALRRPLSRNTHYWLYDYEVEGLRKDPRIAAINLKPVELGMKVRRLWTETSDEWNKSSTVKASHKNWGLLRVIEGAQREGWGSDNIPNQSASISLTEEGRNVDIIIVDGHIDPEHPEFDNRVKQLDWNTLTADVLGIDNDFAGGLSSKYVYAFYTGKEDNNHATHVAGIAAGNSQGWARSANIYNISPYDSNPNKVSELIIMDYIRAFHRNKEINPDTGYKTPTIVNNSWGYNYEIYLDNDPVLNVIYQGNYIEGPFTEYELQNYGIFIDNGVCYAPASYIAVDADVEDAISEGIIVVGAAGNEGTKIDLHGGIDYNNCFTTKKVGTVFYNRGSSPGKAVGSICVGSIDALSTEYKAIYSNCGPRVDIFAPGTNIISSTISGGVPDPRGNGFLDKYSGTSMACPQVCGLLACALELNPTMTPEGALNYLIEHSKHNQITDDTYLRSLQGAPNRYLAR
jgi:subtilisin family serine protease